jgi:hemolysin activation/secretion protein
MYVRHKPTSPQAHKPELNHRATHFAWLLGALLFFTTTQFAHAQFQVQAAATASDPSAQFQRAQQQIEQLRQRNETGTSVLDAATDQAGDASNMAALAALQNALPTNETPCWPLHRVELQSHWPSLHYVHIQSVVRQAIALADDAPSCLGPQGIDWLVKRAQNELIGLGYITAQVQLPAQDLNQGILHLQLSPNRIRSIDLTASTSLSTLPNISPSTLAVQAGDVLNLRDLEQSLENLRRSPNAEASVQIMPIAPTEGDGTDGSTSPTSPTSLSDVRITYQLDRPLRLSLNADDGGSRSTGQLQGSATLSWDNPLGLADLFYVTLGHDVGKTLGYRDPEPRASQNGVLHYSMALGRWQLGGTTSQSSYRQTVVGAFQNYVYSGQSTSSELQIGRTLHRTGSSKTSASVKAFARGSNNFIDDTEVEVQRRQVGGWEAGLQHTQHLPAAWWGGSIDANATYRHGTGAFGAMPAPEEGLGEGTSRMRLMQAQLNWQTPLPWLEQLTGGRWTYTSQVRWQWNLSALSPQDRFCLGGRYTVRGFDGNQSLCAERGRLWRQEFAVPLHLPKPDQTSESPKAPESPLSPLPVQLQAYVALDAGRISGPSTHPERTPLAGRYLGGMALGLRAFVGGPTLAKTQGQTQLDVFVGKPLHQPQGFDASKGTVGFNLSMSF